jgi:hypothetical protein
MVYRDMVDEYGTINCDRFYVPKARCIPAQGILPWVIGAWSFPLHVRSEGTRHGFFLVDYAWISKSRALVNMPGL